MSQPSGNSDVFITCKHCAEVFLPDLKTRGPWVCPYCERKNPNLRRHYRSVADVMIIGLMIGGGKLAFQWADSNGPFLSRFSIADLVQAMHLLILFSAVIAIYRSKTPWANNTIKALIWVIYGATFLANMGFSVLVGLHLTAMLLLAYIPLFTYLLWLHVQARKCSF
jgi:hypothetical protein